MKIFKGLIAIVLLIFILFILSNIIYAQNNDNLTQPSIVKISGQKGNWRLLVNNKPFYIKGVGFADHIYEDNIDTQFKLCKELGANAIRRWGVSNIDHLILDKCEEYGLMAMMGFWLPVDLDYTSDEERKNSLLEEIEYFVNEYKDHPNVLMWGIGNEVIILGEQLLAKKDTQLSREELRERRISFAKYLQKVCERIHEIDPNHPIVYTDAGLIALRYIKDYTPDLDIYGVNFYGGIFGAYGGWKASGVDIPYVFTECAYYGHWEVPKTIGKQPIELSDQKKAKIFKESLRRAVFKHKGSNLGAFAFMLTEKLSNRVEGSSPTWWGLTYKGYKNASFWAVRQVYTGKKPSNYPPVIEEFNLNKVSGIKPNEIISLQLKVSDKENNALKLKIKAFDIKSLSFLKGYSENIARRKGKFKIKAPSKEGLYRLFLFATDNKGNIASANRVISVE